MDRLDLHVQLARVELRELAAGRRAESSDAIRARVQRAHGRQATRYRLQPGVALNAHAGGRWLDSHGGMDRDARSLLVIASERLALSARGYHRVMRVARTIADLADDDRVAREHVAEALRFRPATAEAVPITRRSAAIR